MQDKAKHYYFACCINGIKLPYIQSINVDQAPKKKGATD